jgi:hypothetical protein
VARVLMGLIRDRNGMWCVQRKVPERLQIAVALVLNNGRRKQVHLKKSLGTKDLKAANIRATSVIASFDRTIASATKLADQDRTPAVQRHSLNGAEIARMAEALYGKLLSDDATWRFGGRAQHAREIEQLEQIKMDGWDFTPRYPLDATPEFGWSSERLNDEIDHNDKLLRGMQEALARGDISAVGDDVATLLSDFQIDLDKSSPSYHELGTQALLAYVHALQAIEKRNAGEAVETPQLTRGGMSTPAAGGNRFDGVYLGRQEGKQLIYAGKVGHGFDSVSAKDLQMRLKPLIRKTQPYTKKIAHRGIWVEPSLLAEIEYRAKSGKGKVRHPFFKGIREDL